MRLEVRRPLAEAKDVDTVAASGSEGASVAYSEASPPACDDSASVVTVSKPSAAAAGPAWRAASATASASASAASSAQGVWPHVSQAQRLKNKLSSVSNLGASTERTNQRT